MCGRTGPVSVGSGLQALSPNPAPGVKVAFKLIVCSYLLYVSKQALNTHYDKILKIFDIGINN